MITKSTMNAIAPMVEQANALNLQLGATDTSVLGALIQAAETPVVDSTTVQGSWEDAWLDSLNGDVFFGSTAPVVVNTDEGEVLSVPVSIHSETMDRAAGIIANSVNGALNRARNVVKPLINELIDKVEAGITTSQIQSEPYEIVDVGVHPAWTNSVIMGSLLRFEHYRRPEKVARADIPRIPMPADIAGYMVTGNGSVDQDIAALLKSANLTVEQVYASVFLSNDDLGGYIAEGFENRNLVLLQYLLCNALMIRPVPGSGLNSQAWELLTTKLALATGSACYFEMKAVEEDRNNNRLLYKYDLKTGRIILNSVVYDSYLEQGGTPELIYGAVLSNEIGKINPVTLLGEADRFKAAWSRYHTALRVSKSTAYFSNLKSAAYTAFCQLVEGVDPTLLHPTANKAAILDQAKQYCDTIKPYQSSNVGHICLDLVCDFLFSHTPSKYLLIRINELCEAGRSGEEAATEVVIEYVADWMASAVCFRK